MSLLSARRSVAVVVDLFHGPAAGGHVKAWERFAEATASLRDPLLDLTVYFLGERERVVPLTDHVRYHHLPPVLSTERLRFIRQGGGHTDLARHHRRLAGYLARHDVLHATSAFVFGRTAARIAHAMKLPLVYSMHTDAPGLARVYTQDVVRDLLGRRNPLTSLLLDGLKVHEWSERAQRRAVERILRASAKVFVSSDMDHRHAGEIAGEARVCRLRRGIDRLRFDPARRDRGWLSARFGFDPNCPVVLFAGRVDDSKRVMIAVDAVARLNAEGRTVRLLLAGDGLRAADARARLGEMVALAGNLPQEELARVMASADVFVFPSEIETFGNVVVEARAAGMPVVVSRRAPCAGSIGRNGVDGVVVDDAHASAAWSAAIAHLIDNPQLRRQMGLNARRHVEASWPSWVDVVREDLLPVWRDPYGARQRTGEPTAAPNELAA